ncbi:MAG TPA: YtfJ family protein [Prolixibacteraceae bacterium]|nr:YtfJ family protein [Prolixibacteraceae bacterium]
MLKNLVSGKNCFSVIVALFSFFFLLPTASEAQTGNAAGKSMTALKISDANNDPKVIPFVGEKVLLIQYTDPDVKDINDKLSDAVKAKKFDQSLYQGIGIANCKDTWIPNAGIRMKARQKEKQYAGSIVMLDEDHVLPKALGLGDCNGKGILMVVGKDKIVKYMKAISSEDESLKVTDEVIKLLEEEMKK